MKTYKFISLKYHPQTPDSPWQMAADANKYPTGKGNYGKLVVPRGDDGQFIFKVQGDRIDFHPTVPINIWAVDRTKKDFEQQFKWEFLADGSLVIHNPNEDTAPADYHYQLNFVGVGPLDPIIQNGCCKSRVAPDNNMVLLTDTSSIAYLLAAVAALVLIAARARRRREI